MALHFRRLSTRVFCSTLCVFRLLCSQANTETFQYGEFCIALDKKQRKFLFKLKEGEKFSRSTGYIKHSDVVGLLPGSKIKDHRGSVAYLFRPTLEEYVLLMKRGPTPTYPKDVHAMMSMMDISPGCHVIEGGSGSGAMTLFLSRAVFPEGRVYSFETNPAHLEVARRNYVEWLTHGNRSVWTDNVTFLETDLAQSTMLTEIGKVHGVALDVQHPVNVVRHVVDALLPSGVLTVYLPNITQVAELIQEVTHMRAPVVMDRIVEVVHRNWDVGIRQRNRECAKHSTDGFSTSSTSSQLSHTQGIMPDKVKEGIQVDWGQHSLQKDTYSPFGLSSTICTARPSHRQEPHTAFLVKFRKLN